MKKNQEYFSRLQKHFMFSVEFIFSHFFPILLLIIPALLPLLPLVCLNIVNLILFEKFGEYPVYTISNFGLGLYILFSIFLNVYSLLALIKYIHDKNEKKKNKLFFYFSYAAKKFSSFFILLWKGLVIAASKEVLAIFILSLLIMLIFPHPISSQIFYIILVILSAMLIVKGVRLFFSIYIYTAEGEKVETSLQKSLKMSENKSWDIFSLAVLANFMLGIVLYFLNYFIQGVMNFDIQYLIANPLWKVSVFFFFFFLSMVINQGFIYTFMYQLYQEYKNKK